MKITDLEIERFGVWHDLTLPLAGGGLNVVYGPNEAGKSTLKRFIRAMLFGGTPPQFEANATQRPHDDFVAAGSLRFTHQQEAFRLRRQLTSVGTGPIELTSSGDGSHPPRHLEEILAGTSEAVFDRLFAIDLYELQELSRLDHREIANQVYGLSLGLGGRRLLNEIEELRRHQHRICSPDGTSGRLPALIAEEQSLIEKMRSLPNLSSARGELVDQKDRLDAEIARWKKRRGDVERDLRGRRFLERVHPIWRQVEDYRGQLAPFAHLVDLPADGLAQLDEIDREISSLRAKQNSADERAEAAGRRAEALGPEPELLRTEPALRALIGMRPWVEKTQKQRDEAPPPPSESVPSPAPQHAARPISPNELGAGWTAERIAAVDTTPQAQLSLLDAARRYRLALGRRSLLQKRYKRQQNSLTKREAFVQERLDELGRSPDAVASDLRRELAALETRNTINELRAKEDFLSRRTNQKLRLNDNLADAFEIPHWVNTVLALFALGGAIFVILGLITWVTHTWIAGAAYLMLGLTSGSIALKLRTHFEEAIADTASRVRSQGENDELELRKIREELRGLGGETRHPGAPTSTALAARGTSAETLPLAEHVRAAVKQFGDLDDLVSMQARIQSRRKDLTALRARLRKVQQHVEAQRQAWCQALVDVGMPESLEIDESLATWQKIVESVPSHVVTVTTDSGHGQRLLSEALSGFASELETIGRPLGIWDGPAGKPLAILNDWNQKLEKALAANMERQRHLDEAERHRQEAANCELRLAELARQQTTLLAAAGVRSRADYDQRLRSLAERHELQELLHLAEFELETLASAEPDLAIVEEDMRRYRVDQNQQTLAQLAQEFEELEAKLESALERRGEIGRRLQELAGDRRALSLTQRKNRVESLMQRMSQQLLAVSAASEAAESARFAYEQDRQPAVLKSASQLLAQLTQKRFVRIWAPLGERTLLVDDDQGRTYKIGELSSGTREQLFLALRLGMVRRAAEQGIELPLILDDVFVNFDQLRTEAAFETLLEFAEQGHQILFFTCHLHIANLSEQWGLPPIWLPENQSRSTVQQSPIKAQPRLAG